MINKKIRVYLSLLKTFQTMKSAKTIGYWINQVYIHSQYHATLSDNIRNDMRIVTFGTEKEKIQLLASMASETKTTQQEIFNRIIYYAQNYITRSNKNESISA